MDQKRRASVVDKAIQLSFSALSGNSNTEENSFNRKCKFLILFNKNYYK